MNLTTQEQHKLQEQGVYVRERCDHRECTYIIGAVSFAGKAGRVYCSRACHDAEEQPTKLKEKKPMVESVADIAPLKERAKATGRYIVTATQKRANTADKFMGIVAPGTTIAKILEAMLDGKWHSKEGMKTLRVKDDDSIGYRLTLLEQKGSKSTRPFKLEYDGDDKVRLISLDASSAKSVKVIDAPVEE